jgi:hypothetical protein
MAVPKAVTVRTNTRIDRESNAIRFMAGYLFQAGFKNQRIGRMIRLPAPPNNHRPAMLDGRRSGSYTRGGGVRMEALADIVVVQPSRTGRGVFARVKLDPGTCVGFIEGRTIVNSAYCSRYAVNLGHGHFLEPDEPFSCLNHSCEPNCKIFYEDLGADRPAETLWVETLRLIQPDEELTIDYEWSADWAIPCTCGSWRCRGWIVAEYELDRLT